MEIKEGNPSPPYEDLIRVERVRQEDDKLIVGSVQVVHEGEEFAVVTINFALKHAEFLGTYGYDSDTPNLLEIDLTGPDAGPTAEWSAEFTLGIPRRMLDWHIVVRKTDKSEGTIFLYRPKYGRRHSDDFPRVIFEDPRYRARLEKIQEGDSDGP